VLVVEHDEETIRRADYVIDLVPALAATAERSSPAGRRRRSSLCRLPDGRLHGRRQRIAMLTERRSPNGKAITVLGARENNLKNLDITFPSA